MTVVAHNLTAQYTNRQLNLTTNRKSKSSEKLASGYKINRGADDAAGLQISEKMRGQIRGLNQASRNIQDGVSLCQIAEGGLNETHSLLQRMRELAVQAANDTNTDADRSAISQEINQLTTEVDRIARTTSFNGSIYPLNAQKLESPYVYTAGNAVYELKEVTVSNAIRNPYPEDHRFYGTWGRSKPVTVNGDNYYLGDSVQLRGVTLDGADAIIVNKGFVEHYNSNAVAYALKTDGNIRSAITLMNTRDMCLTDLRVDENKNVYFTSAGGKKMYVGIDSYGEIGASKDMKDSWLTYFKGVTSDNTLHIQSGALRDQSIDMEMIDATCSGIGLGVPVQVSSFEEAGASIENIDQAIENVSAYRSTWGALQNRLEHAMSVDDNTAENTQYAESRIRDTDMAEEMVEYAKNNILEQVGQSMLAQANQSNQGVLSLLQ